MWIVATIVVGIILYSMADDNGHGNPDIDDMRRD